MPTGTVECVLILSGASGHWELVRGQEVLDITQLARLNFKEICAGALSYTVFIVPTGGARRARFAGDTDGGAVDNPITVSVGVHNPGGCQLPQIAQADRTLAVLASPAQCRHENGHQQADYGNYHKQFNECECLGAVHIHFRRAGVLRRVILRFCYNSRLPPKLQGFAGLYSRLPSKRTVRVSRSLPVGIVNGLYNSGRRVFIHLAPVQFSRSDASRSATTM